MASDRKDRAEFDREYAANTRISGYGADVTTHLPCPGCAAADWILWPIVNPPTDAKKCRACGRTFQILISRTPNGTRMTGEIVQIDGPDLPDWYEPKPRRAARDLHRTIDRLRSDERP